MMAFTMRREFTVILLVFLAGCSRVPMLPGLSPYKVEIQQGNYVTQDMVAKLKPGMTRSQVRFILGTPLVADPFHADRWDYVYQLQKRGELKESRHITIVFDQDKLARIEGDVVPSGEAKTAGGVDTRSATPNPAGRAPAEGSGTPKSR
jgi:outer membrane protein assembly factor BamE